MAGAHLMRVEQVVAVPEREREADLKHHCPTDDLGAALKTPERVGPGHDRTFRPQPAPLKANPSEKKPRQAC